MTGLKIQEEIKFMRQAHDYKKGINWYSKEPKKILKLKSVIIENKKLIDGLEK